VKERHDLDGLSLHFVDQPVPEYEDLSKLRPIDLRDHPTPLAQGREGRAGRESLLQDSRGTLG
jgi:hypothetical protein